MNASIESSRRLAVLGAGAREMALAFRPLGRRLDREPGAIADFLDVPGIRALASLSVPERFNDRPLTVDGHRYYGTSALERVIALEHFAWGDAGMVLAAPGPSLAGQLVLDLGSEEQQRRFYHAILAAPTWTFFALTEPERGSDASALQTRLTAADAGWRIDGEKKYIGNGARASLGVVFARTSDAPMSVTGILVAAGASGISRTPLATLGVCGAELCHVRFDNVRVEPADVLGRHLPPLQRGLWGAISTFNRMRPGVAAIALGVARAALEHLRELRVPRSGRWSDQIEAAERELAGVRRVIHHAARLIDEGQPNGHLSSVSKLRAVRLAERATELALRAVGPGALLDDPYLDKWYRDARAFEFMEGTREMQQLNIYAGLSKGRLGYAHALAV